MKPITVLLFLLSAGAAFNQDKLQWGSDIKIDPYSQGYELVGIQHHKVLGLRRESHSSIEVFNEETLLAERKFKVRLNYGGEKIRPVDYFVFQDHLLLIGTYRNNAAKSTVYTLNEINAEGTITSSLELAAFKMPVMVFVADKRPDADATFKYQLSDDGKNLIITFRDEEDAISGQTSYQLKVIDGELKAQVAPFAVPVGAFNLEAVNIKETGEVTLIGYSERADETGKVERNGNYIFSFDLSQTEVVTVQELDRNIRTMSIKQVKDNLVVYGIYADGPVSIGNGTYVIELNKENKIAVSVQQAYDFNKAVILPARDNSWHRFVLKDLVVTDKGDYLLSLEESQSYNSAKKAAGEMMSSGFEDFGKIVIISVAPSGSLKWTKEITRDQPVSAGVNNSQSFYQVYANNGLSIIYNVPPDSSAKTNKVVTVRKAIIDEAGSLTNTDIAAVEDFIRRGIDIQQIMGTSSGELIVYVRSSMNKGQFARLVLQ